jgi:hypothetical protein
MLQHSACGQMAEGFVCYSIMKGGISFIHHTSHVTLHILFSVLAVCLSLDSVEGELKKVMREMSEMQQHQQHQQPLMSKLHVFEPPSSSGAVSLWAVENGASLIRTRGTCSPLLPTPVLPSAGGITSMTCSGRLCCATLDAGDDLYADGGGRCWLVTLDTSSVCRVVHHMPPTPLAKLSPSLPFISSSLCTDGALIFALSTFPSPQLTVLSPLPPPQPPFIHHTARISPHASHVTCAPSFSLLSSSSTAFILPPPPSCVRSAACLAPVYHPSIPIPSAMSRDLACALHPMTLSLICWGDAPLAAIVPLVIVCVSDGSGGCLPPALSRGDGGYELAPRLYDSSHSDGRFFDIMPVPQRGIAGTVCDLSTDVARILVLSVSFEPSPQCTEETCSCTMSAQQLF